MKILIADDESLVRQSIRLFLLDLGVQPEDLTEAANGLTLSEALKNNYFDLALVDIQMPYMNGLEAIRDAQAS
ncbi:MAG: response regulator, partial [Lachnospiraceae bacterium]